MNEKKQRQILAAKFFDATAESHPTIKAMLDLVTIDGFEQKNSTDYIFQITTLPGKETELETLKSPGGNFAVSGIFNIDRPFDISTWKNFVWVYVNLTFRDGLLSGFSLKANEFWNIEKDFAAAIKYIRKRRKVTWLIPNTTTPTKKLSKRRKAFLEDFDKRVKDYGDKLPLLTLTEFFDGNKDEESIAPNQWEAGRPKLNEIWMRLCEIEQRQDVAWVRVQLHSDTLFEKDEKGMICAVAGEAIAICTSANIKELEKAVDTKSLCSDGIIEGWVPTLDKFTDIPTIPEGNRIVLLVWD